MYVITAPRHFLRRSRLFFKRHPDLKPRFKKFLVQLQNDPFQSSLGLHPLSGILSDCCAASLAYSYRVTLLLLVKEKEVVLLDIGTHDEVYGRK